MSQIGNGAFANGSGLLSANVASGNGNLQSNAAVLAPAASVRIEAISDGLLAAESAGGVARVQRATQRDPARQSSSRMPTATRRAWCS
ncbi:hypothetical protein ACU4HD_35670 [Cupriavidus basilensis]